MQCVFLGNDPSEGTGMKCWKCGQENVSGAMQCVHCNADMRRTEPKSVEGKALRRLYDHYGAEALLTNSALMVNALGDLMQDSNKIRNQLKMALAAGIGRAYLLQIQSVGNSDSDFENRMLEMMTEDAGLSEAVSKKIMSAFDEMIGWKGFGETYAEVTSRCNGSEEKRENDDQTYQENVNNHREDISLAKKNEQEKKEIRSKELGASYNDQSSEKKEISEATGKLQPKKPRWWLFGIFSVLYLFMNYQDSVVYGMRIYGKLFPSPRPIDMQIIPLLTFALAGAFPLISILAGNKKKRKIAMVCAILGLCGCIVVEYVLFQLHGIIPFISWIFFFISLLVLLFATKSGRKKWMSITCFLLALVTIVFSIFFTYCRLSFESGQMIFYVWDFQFWESSHWFKFLYDSWLIASTKIQKIPALFILPFSRGFLLLAIAFGIRLLPTNKHEPSK